MFLAKATLCLNSSSVKLENPSPSFEIYKNIFLDCNNCSISEMLFYHLSCGKNIRFVLKMIDSNDIFWYTIIHIRNGVAIFFFLALLSQNSERHHRDVTKQPLLMNLNLFSV
jgi:hypothetical protein